MVTLGPAGGKITEMEAMRTKQTTVTVLKWLGIVASSLSVASYIPILVRAFIDNDENIIYIPALALSVSSAAIWLIYGILEKSVVTIGFSVLLIMIILALIIW